MLVIPPIGGISIAEARPLIEGTRLSRRIISRPENETVPDTPLREAALRPNIDFGTSSAYRFPVVNQALEIGDTGLGVYITDLHLAPSETQIHGSNPVRLPSYVERGAALVYGTDHGNDIVVQQNEQGETLLHVANQGRESTINLGTIAALHIEAGAGNDSISVGGRLYFGGVQVNGAGGSDLISVQVADAYRRGVTIDGGSGADQITLSGDAIAVLARGGDGNDNLNLRAVVPDQRFIAQVEGGGGRDYIQGHGGNNKLYGNDGDDLVFGGPGPARLSGGEGNDVLAGGRWADLIEGNAGDDILRGQSGDDILRGGSGNDWLYAGSGRDRLEDTSGANTYAPLLEDPRAYHVRFRQTGGLNVLERGAVRLQTDISDTSLYRLYGKFMPGYDPAGDFIADSRFRFI